MTVLPWAGRAGRAGADLAHAQQHRGHHQNEQVLQHQAGELDKEDELYLSGVVRLVQLPLQIVQVDLQLLALARQVLELMLQWKGKCYNNVGYK